MEGRRDVEIDKLPITIKFSTTPPSRNHQKLPQSKKPHLLFKKRGFCVPRIMAFSIRLRMNNHSILWNAFVVFFNTSYTQNDTNVKRCSYAARGRRTEDPSEIGLQKHFTGQAEGRGRTEGGNGTVCETAKRRVGEKGNKGIMLD